MANLPLDERVFRGKLTSLDYRRDITAIADPPGNRVGVMGLPSQVDGNGATATTYLIYLSFSCEVATQRVDEVVSISESKFLAGGDNQKPTLNTAANIVPIRRAPPGCIAQHLHVDAPQSC